MESWLIYAIISAFGAGLYSFMTKVAAERKYNTSLMMVYSYLFATISSGIYCFYYEYIWLNKLNVIFFLAIGNSLFYFISTVTRVKSMRFIDATIFFPIYKVVGPILVTIISLFYFSEALNFKEFFGILIGIIIPMLLITKSEITIQKDLKKGFIFIVVAALSTSIAAIFAKRVPIENLNIETYIFVSMFVGILFSFGSYKFIQKNNIQQDNKKGLIPFTIMLSILHVISILTFTKALTGNLAVVFTINSFSILITITLAVFFYREHFNIKKGVVIALSILSILLFI